MNNVLPLETWSFNGRNLPAADSLVQPPTNEFDITAHIVNKLRQCPHSKQAGRPSARKIMENCFELKRLISPKSWHPFISNPALNTEKASRLKAIAIYLTEDGSNNSPCTFCVKGGLLNKCVSDGGGFGKGACTNCLYKSDPVHCSLHVRGQTDEPSSEEPVSVNAMPTPVAGEYQQPSFLHDSIENMGVAGHLDKARKTQAPLKGYDQHDDQKNGDHRHKRARTTNEEEQQQRMTTRNYEVHRNGTLPVLSQDDIRRTPTWVLARYRVWMDEELKRREEMRVSRPESSERH
ncbi:hypothetical protein F4778DRAFT_692108 [Xylariomycetidae sp. FL2044]|nr:hypothetical protein F4778DRAFT_692108 [Xylariomycetidae sp. FL2044]